jgi:hypothetical protein
MPIPALPQADELQTATRLKVQPQDRGDNIIGLLGPILTCQPQQRCFDRITGRIKVNLMEHWTQAARQVKDAQEPAKGRQQHLCQQWSMLGREVDTELSSTQGRHDNYARPKHGAWLCWGTLGMCCIHCDGDGMHA